MTALHELSAREAAAALRRGDVSAVELLAALEVRADRWDAVVGAYVHRTPALAARQARHADAALADARRGGPDALAALPPLLGVPVPVKDLHDLAGVPAAYGSPAFTGTVPVADSGAVALLRAAGVVVPGKTTTPELGLPAYTEPEGSPPARTPWDVRRSAGGSSGGAAATVAAGLAPVAHGSDGGGSLRIPASVCGLVGLKASRGRIGSGADRVDVVGLGTEGALTRDVRDTALLLDVLAQPWPGDPALRPAPPRTTFLDACDRDPGRRRVGLLLDPVIAPDAPVDPRCAAGARSAAAALERLGHEVEPAPVPFGGERFAAFRVLWSVGAARAPVPDDRAHLLRPLTRWLRGLGHDHSGVEVLQALEGLHRATRDTALAWERYDAVLTPTLAQAPARVGALRDDADPAADFLAQMRYTPWTSIANLTGRPAVSLPVHRTDVDGVELPFGAMLTGRIGGEEVLLGLAAQLEDALPWRGTVPRDPDGAAAAGVSRTRT